MKSVNIVVTLPSGIKESLSFDLSNQFEASTFDSWLKTSIFNGCDFCVVFFDPTDEVSPSDC